MPSDVARACRKEVRATFDARRAGRASARATGRCPTQWASPVAPLGSRLFGKTRYGQADCTTSRSELDWTCVGGEMNERNTIHSRRPSAMHESEAVPHVHSSETPAARAGESHNESYHILVHTGDPVSGPFAALRPRGL